MHEVKLGKWTCPSVKNREKPRSFFCTNPVQDLSVICGAWGVRKCLWEWLRYSVVQWFSEWAVLLILHWTAESGVRAATADWRGIPPDRCASQQWSRLQPAAEHAGWSLCFGRENYGAQHGPAGAPTASSALHLCLCRCVTWFNVMCRNNNNEPKRVS